jgi:hypothetical protein
MKDDPARGGDARAKPAKARRERVASDRGDAPKPGSSRGAADPARQKMDAETDVDALTRDDQPIDPPQ